MASTCPTCHHKIRGAHHSDGTHHASPKRPRSERNPLSQPAPHNSNPDVYNYRGYQKSGRASSH